MIYKDNKGVNGVFKLDTPIYSVYKGVDLVWRLGDSSVDLTGNVRGNFTDYKYLSSIYTKIYEGGNRNNGVNLMNFYTNEEKREFEYQLSPTTTYAYLLYDCEYLERIYLPFNQEITSLAFTFYDCHSLVEVEDIDKWNTKNVTSMASTFYGCTQLMPDVSKWNVSNVVSMNQMFMYCGATSLNLSKWKIADGINVNYMFFDMEDMITLNIANWDFSNVASMFRMFYSCNGLQNVIGPIKGIKFDVDLKYSEQLTHDSAMVFINGLAEVEDTKTLTFDYRVKNKLSEEEIAIATSKGWSIA